MWCYNLSEPQSADPNVSKFDCMCFRARALLVTSSDYIFKTHGIQRLVMLTNDSACIWTIGYVVLHFIRASARCVSKFDCKCFRARALLVTSSNNILKTLGIQRLVMLTNDSACIANIGYVVQQFIRASERQLMCLKV